MKLGGTDMELKNYQINALYALKLYLEECSVTQDADVAYYKVTRDLYETGLRYNPVRELPGLPYVCLRIPTGGGKTLVASHAVGIAAHSLLHTETAMVLWLVPSTTILEQTLMALKNPTHPYNRALRSSLGNVAVYSVSEAFYLSPAVVQAETVIIVSTIQAFRVEDTEGRKVYETAGQLKPLFANLPAEALKDVERDDNGEVIPSLANVLHMHKPIVIVDEAHNARTLLSFETLARFSPSCIIEFTATPDTDTNPSNVLYSVSAAELKAENMIKLPILLETKSDWKAVVHDAISTRGNLEKIALNERLETGEYIRPILLLQAEAHRAGQERITWEVLEKHLLEDYGFPREQVAVETGNRRDLEGVDILSEDCPIRYIITVQALKEGWDCPFAYALCSVAELRSSTAVEQILGRILRLPKVKPKVHKELNMAYAFSCSNSFGDVANALTDALVQNGFERQEAKDFIKERRKYQQYEQDNEPTLFPPELIEIKITEVPELKQLSDEILSKLEYNHESGSLILKQCLSAEEQEILKDIVKKPENRDAIFRGLEALEIGHTYNLVIPDDHKSPAEKGYALSIPVLAIQQDGLFEQFEETHFLEIPWQLSKCDPTLDADQYSVEEECGQLGEITVTDQGQVRASFIRSIQEQMTLFVSNHGWEVKDLILWLDQRIPHPDISGEDTQIFLTKVILYLTEIRGIPLERLIKDRYRLQAAIARKIDQIRKEQRLKGWQQILFSDGSFDITVSPEVVFTYNLDPFAYPCRFRYQGRYKFRKHYYPFVGELKDTGEEFECARYIDLLPEVNCWVRNLERQPEFSFWLQTSTDKFYPDFVCQLKDGRFLVVEYKGAQFYSNEETKEKRLLGELWEAKSGGQCLFVMPTERNYEEIRNKINYCQ
jgi:type III restriction enzyme